MEEKSKIQYYSKVKNKKVQWLWYPYIPYGKITIIQGDPGEGKTSLALYLTSIISNGGKLPFQETELKPMTVIYQNREDGVDDTIKPRLDSYGANCEEVCYVENDNTISLSDDSLEDTIIKTNAKVLILDPIQAFLNECNMLRANSVRPVMTNLLRIADKTNCAIIFVGHLNKNENGKDLYRGMGSIDISAVARSVIMVSAENSDERRKMVHIKSNLARKGNTLLFSLRDNTLTDWEMVERGSQKESSISERIEKELLSILGESGLDSVEVYAHLNKLGYKNRTIARAKKNLKIKSVKQGKNWIWIK